MTHRKSLSWQAVLFSPFPIDFVNYCKSELHFLIAASCLDYPPLLLSAASRVWFHEFLTYKEGIIVVFRNSTMMRRSLNQTPGLYRRCEPIPPSSIWTQPLH